jgi:hypothetical protein
LGRQASAAGQDFIATGSAGFGRDLKVWQFLAAGSRVAFPATRLSRSLV